MDGWGKTSVVKHCGTYIIWFLVPFFRNDRERKRRLACGDTKIYRSPASETSRSGTVFTQGKQRELACLDLP